MKNPLISLSLIFFLSSLQPFVKPSPTPLQPTVCFVQGEHLTYQVHYSWLDAGIINMVVDKELHTINGNTCYKIDLAGKLKGLLYLALKIKQHFGSYINTKQLIPQLFYRNIHEGTYKKNERLIFDHIQKQVQLEELNDNGTEVIDKKVFNVVDNVQDIVSYLYVVLRNIDFSQLRPGEILHSPVFFDNILHERFPTKFLGKKKIKTKLGYINAIVVAPLVPLRSTGNSIFASENSIELFLSEDENKIPLKAKLKLIVGAVEMDLIQYEGTKSPLAVTK